MYKILFFWHKKKFPIFCKNAIVKPDTKLTIFPPHLAPWPVKNSQLCTQFKRKSESPECSPRQKLALRSHEILDEREFRRGSSRIFIAMPVLTFLKAATVVHDKLSPSETILNRMPSFGVREMEPKWIIVKIVLRYVRTELSSIVSENRESLKLFY